MWHAIAILCSAFIACLPHAEGQGNIVEDPTFQLPWQLLTNAWSGNFGLLAGWATVPNGNCATVYPNIFQNIPTTAGQEYAISFYAAADLLTGSSIDIAVSLNNEILATFETPPYPYNNQTNRYDQMHWQQFTSSFVASTSPTLLEFSALNPVDFGLTGVRVIAVPEPSSCALLLVVFTAAIFFHREGR
jgi:hypothetical protein